jgi:hypothetical protein
MTLRGMLSVVRRSRPEPEPALRVEPQELGLAVHPELGTFLQFSSAGSRASRESLNRLALVVAPQNDRATVIELTVNSGSPVQRRLGVRHVPSVYLINQRGVVTHHWARTPQIDELQEALGAGNRWYAPAHGAS